jgi:predicted methyltransferase
MRSALVGVVGAAMVGGFASAQAPARPAGDVAKDAHRHPAEVTAFAGVKPGDTVIELVPGGGYFTRVLSAAVGPSGKVYAVIPNWLAQRKPEAVASERAIAAEPGYGNVRVVVEGLGSIADQGPADVVFTAQNYHDLHLKVVPPGTALQVDQAVLAALKPGGVYVVEDHVAAAGSGETAPDSLHRIDPAYARAEIEKSGLVFDGESKVLANTADPHTAIVFDPSIRGRTDQFLFRFRKPR